MRITHLAGKISKELKIPKVHVFKILTQAEKEIFTAIQYGQEIHFKNIGKIVHVKIAERPLHHWTTKKMRIVPAGYRLKFKVATKMKHVMYKKIVY